MIPGGWRRRMVSWQELQGEFYLPLFFDNSFFCFTKQTEQGMFFCHEKTSSKQMCTICLKKAVASNFKVGRYGAFTWRAIAGIESSWVDHSPQIYLSHETAIWKGNNPVRGLAKHGYKPLRSHGILLGGSSRLVSG